MFHILKILIILSLFFFYSGAVLVKNFINSFGYAQTDPAPRLDSHSSQVPEIPWTPMEISLLKNMHISKALRLKPSHPFLHDPKLAQVGQTIFFDTSLSHNGTMSCASCHNPRSFWTGGNFAEFSRKSNDKDPPSLMFSPYFRFLNWDGSADSLYMQSMNPFTNPKEHGLSEADLIKKLKANSTYHEAWKSFQKKACYVTKKEKKTNQKWCALSPIPFVGMALESFLWDMEMKPGPFDQFIESLSLSTEKQTPLSLSQTAQQGLKLFLGKGNCVSCHYGPLLSDGEFHSVGAPNQTEEPDERGRVWGVHKLLNSPNHCLGRPSYPFLVNGCKHLLFLPINRVDQVGAYRTPSLRNVSQTAPYFHSGAIPNLEGVIRHYSFAVSLSMGDLEIVPLNLSEKESFSLQEFLKMLNSEVQNRFLPIQD